ncbi:MAG: hypothetical protein ACO4B5_06340, partial [Steroidobacteraceae bacterium]
IRAGYVTAGKLRQVCKHTVILRNPVNTLEGHRISRERRATLGEMAQPASVHRMGHPGVL